LVWGGNTSNKCIDDEMKRKIKFRAVIEKENSEIQFDFYSLDQIDGYSGMTKSSSVSGKLIDRNQFTGLKDKNGKEIYEGDILYFKDTNKRELKCIVEWEHSGWGKRPFDYGHSDIWAGWNDYEIIGNIYINSELLK
jgi:uncharacterized phage protein (TIGR01671 family)